ncbi:uncharacterized protein BO66DRAFT_135874 [Aspergillus aculeatinus CBS 121060]|uniref:Uncharacterized protein n=1 Tax=Aspergillus aculeatinus CBS 121060 TaxID=1448322 RepID=A0ACD1H416_9EURO|nr:hypothetical protein BO66DRAFT_135874 [Aspergillus aculeatinus CBS 121060]RAH68166.1 hypothetical protein BO66DRAFT_135874 [Aspergillus aculeatinus CBS 121060]
MMFQNKDLSHCVMQLVTGSVPNKHRGLLGGLPVLAATLNSGGLCGWCGCLAGLRLNSCVIVWIVSMVQLYSVTIEHCFIPLFRCCCCSVIVVIDLFGPPWITTCGPFASFLAFCFFSPTSLRSRSNCGGAVL